MQMISLEQTLKENNYPGRGHDALGGCVLRL